MAFVSTRLFRNGSSTSPTYFVYLMMCRDSGGDIYIKFGHSMQIDKRLQSLRTACPLPVHMFGVVDIGTIRKSVIKIERALHKAFAPRRTQGEWFRFNPKSPDDKAEFNDKCRHIFETMLGRKEYWTKVSAKAVAAEHDARRKRFAKSWFGRKILERQDRIAKFKDKHGISNAA